ncbi:MAG: sel1 repeat family protein [Bacteroidales bacterium]|nr:sel1 repeat family protein [Bacteroidales bacterium]
MNNTTNPKDLYDKALAADRQGNLTEAFAFFKQAAELRHPQALYEYARRCYDGIGCQRDIDTAFLFFKKASYYGILDATLFLENFYTHEAPNDSELPGLYRDGYKNGDPRLAYLHSQVMYAKAQEAQNDEFEELHYGNRQDRWFFALIRWIVKKITELINRSKDEDNPNGFAELPLMLLREAQEAYDFAVSHGYHPDTPRPE